MSIFSKFVDDAKGQAVNRLDHIPEADMPGVVAYVNHLLAPSGTSVTEGAIRAVEQAQALYLMGRLVDQAIPRQLDLVRPLIDNALGSALTADTTPQAPDLPKEA